jgi:hypothetical protein
MTRLTLSSVFTFHPFRRAQPQLDPALPASVLVPPRHDRRPAAGLIRAFSANPNGSCGVNRNFGMGAILPRRSVA